jgi:hypothetical protein
MALFEICIVKMPTTDEEDAGAMETVLVPTHTIVASDVQSAAIKSVMLHAAVLEGVDQGRLNVMTRPF